MDLGGLLNETRPQSEVSSNGFFNYMEVLPTFRANKNKFLLVAV